MKVIKSGKQKKQLMRCTCRKCECLFEFEQPEAKRIFDPRDGDYLQIACPECKHLNAVAV